MAIPSIPQPFARTWWVDAPRLLAGCYPGDTNVVDARKKLQGLLRAGIRGVLCLQEEDETGPNGAPFEPYMPLWLDAASIYWWQDRLHVRSSECIHRRR